MPKGLAELVNCHRFPVDNHDVFALFLMEGERGGVFGAFGREVFEMGDEVGRLHGTAVFVVQAAAGGTKARIGQVNFNTSTSARPA